MYRQTLRQAQCDYARGQSEPVEDTGWLRLTINE
jgi:hypothetical protein